MGILDGRMSDDASMALGLLGLGLLKKDFGAGAANALQYMAGAEDRKLKGLLGQAQLEELKSQSAERQAKLGLLQQRQATINNLLGKLDSANTAANESVIAQTGNLAPTIGNAALQTQAASRLNANNPLFNVPREAIAMDLALNEGKNVSDWLYKRSVPDWRSDGGYRWNANDPTNTTGFLPQMKVSDNGQATLAIPGANGLPVVSAPSGALNTYAQYRGVDEALKAAGNVNLRPEPGPGGRQRPTSVLEESPVLQGILQSLTGGGGTQQPQGGGASMRAEAGVRGAFDFTKDSPEALSAYIAGIRDPQEKANAQAALEEQLRRTGYGMTESEKNAAAAQRAGAEAQARVVPEAQTAINNSWIKTSFEPTLASGQNARDLIDTVQVSRQALTNLGSSGWGTQAKAAAGSVLAGIGIAPKNVQAFTANAEVFQKTAMDRLWTTLNEAKGPQTEGDADRASKTYAALRNTPQANLFILDFAEAKAQRDQMKARFYQQAMPIARSKGDLAEVDREWSARAPSIFSMPSMTRWVGGIK